MRLTMKEKQALTRKLALRYRKASKREKSEILDWLVEVTGYHRSYAARALRQRLTTPSSPSPRKPKGRRRRARTYDHAVFLALRQIWAVCDYLCGKRLAPYLGEIIPVLERCGEILLDPQVRRKLFQISPATIDRLLAAEKESFRLRPRATTKPGTLLKSQIPIRTFSEWDEDRPGFVEVDLVAHEGGDPRGEYVQTLDLTDVCTGWTETKAVKNKAQVWVLEALMQLQEQLPFELLGLDSDNGAEFINAHLLRFCEANEISFTRSRPYRKNDNCYVEQKNYSVVRRAVGYWRYDTPAELEALNRLYDRLRLYTNFFQPGMKLREKVRQGSRVKKRYDPAKTSYHRVLESPFVEAEAKEALKRQYAQLNPVELKEEIARGQEELLELCRAKHELTANDKSGDTLENIFT